METVMAMLSSADTRRAIANSLFYRLVVPLPLT
jgi:hypothetical protein